MKGKAPFIVLKISDMNRIRTTSSGDGLVLEAIEAFDRMCDGVADETRDKVTLLFAAKLCERTAFANAREWEPAAVANLLVLSAQIERMLVEDRKLD